MLLQEIKGNFVYNSSSYEKKRPANHQSTCKVLRHSIVRTTFPSHHNREAQNLASFTAQDNIQPILDDEFRRNLITPGSQPELQFEDDPCAASER